MSNPVRLGKVEHMSILDKIENFILNHAWFFLSLAIIILFVLFITLCWVMVGASATDSGLQYNQFNNIVNGGV